MKLVRVLAVVAVAGVLAACTAPPAAEQTTTPRVDAAQECAAAVAGIVTAVSDLVAGYGESGTLETPPASPTPAPTPSATGAESGSADDALAAAVEAARETRNRLGCDSDDFDSELEAGLTAIDAEGPIADAVSRRISATLLGDLRQDAEDWVVSADDDLHDVLAHAAEGSTVVLPEGTVDVDATLVVLTAITIRGAGREATTLRAHGSDAAVIIATSGLVAFEDLNLELTGEHASSGIVAGPSASVSLTGVRVAGATAAADAVGGAGVYLSAQGREAAGRGTTLEVTDSVFQSNAWAGVAVAGGHRVSIESSTFADNPGAGLLFLDHSSGSVGGSTFTGNAVGVAAAGSSVPTVVSSTVSGGAVGVQADESAAPTIEGLTVRGTSTAAVIFGGSSTGSLSGATCEDVPYGIVVSDTAAPTLGENACQVSRGAP